MSKNFSWTAPNPYQHTSVDERKARFKRLKLEAAVSNVVMRNIASLDVLLDARDPDAIHLFMAGARPVRRTWRSQSGNARDDRKLLDRAFTKLLEEPDALPALRTVWRLSGSKGASAYITRLGRAPTPKLTPEAREAARLAGVRERSARLAKKARARLAKAEASLAKAQKAVERAEKATKTWGAKVRYYESRGVLTA